MNNDTTYKIRPAGRHIFTIGRDLIQDNYAAVLELVKNAYDADSHNVNIEFTAFPDQSGYSIVISDDGHGMSKEDVIYKWMVPSTTDKLGKRKTRSGRNMQGNKGVGRYAAAILGKDLFLETVNDKGEKTTVYLMWENFEDAQYLDDVEILIETTKVSESQGTRLTMKGDRDFLTEWDDDQFKNIRGELKKLKSPVSTVFSDKDTIDPFNISLKIKGFHEVKDVEEIIEPYPVFDLFDYKIAGKISKDGTGMLTYSSQKARNMVEEKILFDFGAPTGCGELDIDIRVFDLEADAIDSLIKRGFKDESGEYVKKREARLILRTNNGIGVYRNGFRIRPLGDADFDWLELNRRRVNIPTRCISSNQAIGYVQIQSDIQSGLIEKSARDGLKENKAFYQLKEVTRKVITHLEWRRFEYRTKARLSRPTSKVEQDLQKLFSFDNMKQSIETKLNKSDLNKTTTDEIIEIINKDEKEKNKIAEEIRQTIAIYQGQATLGQIIGVILHESGQPLNCFKNDVPNLRYWYELFLKTSDLGKLKELMPIVEGIEESADTLVELFNKLNPLTAKKPSAKKLLELKKTIQQTIGLFKGDIQKNKVSIAISGPDNFEFLCWPRDIAAIFTNLIDNSMYWMCEKKIPNKEISIKLVTNDNSLRYIDYQDTGPGIEPSLSKVIFEPYFSTKPDGMGLGLAIAGEAAKRNGLELRVFKSEKGAHFRLQPKKGIKK